MSLSANTKAAMYRQTAGVVALWVCDITHPNVETIRIVNNEEPITVSGATYLPCGFEFKPPDEREKGARPASVEINNADLWLVEMLRSVDDRVRVQFRLVSHSNLGANPPAFDNVEVALQPMKISESTMNSQSAELDLVYSSLAQEAYPPDRFDPNNYRRIQ